MLLYLLYFFLFPFPLKFFKRQTKKDFFFFISYKCFIELSQYSDEKQINTKKPKTIFSKIFQKTKKILNEIQKLFSQLSSIIFAIGEKIAGFLKFFN